MPYGRVAPAKTLPPLLLPINGSTESKMSSSPPCLPDLCFEAECANWTRVHKDTIYRSMLSVSQRYLKYKDYVYFSVTKVSSQDKPEHHKIVTILGNILSCTFQ